MPLTPTEKLCDRKWGRGENATIGIVSAIRFPKYEHESPLE